MGDLGHVNASGFPLQLGLQHLVQQTQGEHGWHFVSREHPWMNETLGCGGFIDLIIENQYLTQVMVIECKRVRDTSWIFLDPSKEAKHETVVNSWVRRKEKECEFSGWMDLVLKPVSPQAEFCIIPGHDPKSRPILERTAAELIDATEALATEELNLIGNNIKSLRVYYPVIITTAELKVCNFDSEDIDIKSGELQSKSSYFSTVPFVRFRKSLSVSPLKDKCFNSIKEIDLITERTVFIVNSGSMLDFLKSMQLDWQASLYL
jgi:Holliday junction resolvase-like predicted endonuclease